MTAICYSLNNLLPSSQDWEDARIKDPKSKTGWRGFVIHLPSGDRYGDATQADSDDLIRKKMALLFFGGFGLLTTFISLPCRIGYLVSGHWAWGVGYSKALTEWKIKRHQCNLAKHLELAPGRLNLYTKVALRSLECFLESAVKLVTLPVAVAFGMGSALVSIYDPHLARRLLSLIQKIWSVHTYRHIITYRRSPSESSRLAVAFGILMNFQAPCMQSRRIKEEYDLYPDVFRLPNFWSQWRDSKRLIQAYKSYFPKDAENWLKKMETFQDQSLRLTPELIESQIKLKKVFLNQLYGALRDFVMLSDLEADCRIAGLQKPKNFFKKNLLGKIGCSIEEVTKLDNSNTDLNLS